MLISSTKSSAKMSTCVKMVTSNWQWNEAGHIFLQKSEAEDTIFMQASPISVISVPQSVDNLSNEPLVSSKDRLKRDEEILAMIWKLQ